MPTTVSREGQPLTPSSSSVLSDVAALRRVFDAEFQKLVAKAASKLDGAASLAPRVAEGALVRAWDARARLESMDQLHAFLDDDITQGAARALARRQAGHHAEDGAPLVDTQVPTVEPAHAWSQIVDAISVDPHTAQQAKDMADAMRHGTAQNLVSATRTISWKTVAGVALGIALVVWGGYTWFDHVATEKAIDQAIASPNGRVTVADFGQVANVTLPDGSKMRLAPGSKLMVPRDFGGKIRSVKLDGSADVDVAQGQPGEFRVYMHHAIAAAKGTRFVATGYWDEPTSIVRVREGTVQMRANKVNTNVEAGRSMVVDSLGVAHEGSVDETDAATGWADGKLTILRRPLREVLTQLQRWYKLDITVQDLKLLDRNVSVVHAPVDSAMAAVNQVEKTGGLKFGYAGTVMVFTDTSAAAAPAAAAAKKK